MNRIQIKWQWQDSQKIPNICAAVAWYDVRLILLKYLLHHSDMAKEKQLQILSHNDVIIVIGESHLLPWVDGIRYAGYDDIEPRLWLPSHRIPSVPISLLSEALQLRHMQSPLLVWDNPKVILPINQAQIINLPLLNLILDSIITQRDKSK